MRIDGAMDDDPFEVYVRQPLASTVSPGDVVVMDNLSAHKRPAVREAI